MIDLRVPGDVAACRATAADVGALADAVDEVMQDLSRTSRQSKAGWEGMAGDRFRRGAEHIHERAEVVKGRADIVARALAVFVDDLDEVNRRMADIRSRAAAAGLRVTEHTISPPDPTPVATGTGTPPPTDPLATAYAHAIEELSRVREVEHDAHDRFQEQLRLANDDGLVTEMLRAIDALPPEHAGGVDIALWLADHTVERLIKAAAPWAFLLWHGRFATRGPFGRFVTTKGASLAQRMDLRQWIPKAGRAALRPGWMSGATKLAGAAGAVIGGAIAGWDQWGKDSDRADLSDSEKVGRAAVRGGVTAGGALAGAAAGAALGSMIPVPVVGTLAGAAVGAAIGSGVADWAADQVMNHTSDVADALTFWD